MWRVVLALVPLAACYVGAGPAAGVSLTHRKVIVGWEATAHGVVGLTGGQVFRHDDRWRTTSWGALDIEWLFVRRVHDPALALPLVRAQLGGAEGDSEGLVTGVSAGALMRPSGICGDDDYSIDMTLSLRRVAGDTQLVVTSRLAFYPYAPGCASP